MTKKLKYQFNLYPISANWDQVIYNARLVSFGFLSSIFKVIDQHLTLTKIKSAIEFILVRFREMWTNAICFKKHV